MLMIGACICGVARMGTQFYVDVCAVPAGIDSFRLCEDAFPVVGAGAGLYHQIIGEGQLAVVVESFDDETGQRQRFGISAVRTELDNLPLQCQNQCVEFVKSSPVLFPIKIGIKLVDGAVEFRHSPFLRSERKSTVVDCQNQSAKSACYVDYICLFALFAFRNMTMK